MKINDLLSDIRKQDLVLPEFQREYVWSLEQTEELMVSLFKQCPVGSLLLWKTDQPPDLQNDAHIAGPASTIPACLMLSISFLKNRKITGFSMPGKPNGRSFRKSLDFAQTAAARSPAELRALGSRWPGSFLCHSRGLRKADGVHTCSISNSGTPRVSNACSFRVRKPMGVALECRTQGALLRPLGHHQLLA